MLQPSDFLGPWRLFRAIEDRLGPPRTFEGTATFTPQGDALRYEESGLLRLGDGPALAATRRYLWAWDAQGVAVLFPDGRPFHRFTPQGAAPGTDHPCGPDLYRVLYDFTAFPLWTATWEVAGPRKSYRLRARYAREAWQRPSRGPQPRRTD